MSFYNIFFSPTGGTKAVSEALKKGFGGEFTDVDMIKDKGNINHIEFNEDDFCFISVPSFGGRIPTCTAEEFGNIKGNRAKVFLTAVFGNRAIDDTLTELSDVLEDRGFTVLGGAEAVAQHSLIRIYGTGRPDSEDIEQLNSFGKKIREVFNSGKINKELTLPGSHTYKKYTGVPMKPYTSASCIECGICARECPVNAIPAENPKITDKDLCISCMHCVAVCPENARGISHVMVSVAGFGLKKACAGRKENKLYI